MSLADVNQLSKVNVDQFYGIEIEEFPARIAEVALWLTDHQANIALSQAFGQFYDRLPLRASPHIVVANALRTDWRAVLPPEQCAFVLGNPPFVGKKEQNAEQKADMELVWGDVQGAGILDYVTAWYRKAAAYLQGTGHDTHTRCAFVSTNSITQGEQVSVLWADLLQHWHIRIHFAHRTFAWESEARGKAHVHVVIIGFGTFDVAAKFLFDYDTPQSEGHAVSARNINPYLIDAPDLVITGKGLLRASWYRRQLDRFHPGWNTRPRQPGYDHPHSGLVWYKSDCMQP